MSLSRRSFFRTAGAAGVGLLSSDFISARGREAFAAIQSSAVAGYRPQGAAQARRAIIKISSNENAYGPGPAALDAARSLLGPAAGRYPTNVPDLAAAVAKHFGVEPQNVLVGTGSGEVIEAAVMAFTSPTRPLVSALPTWESPARTARRIKASVKDIRVDADLKLDLAATTAAAKGAGLVFFCNPNNPTGTVHSKAAVTKFVEGVLAASPQTTILLDEAYYDFVVDPSYATGVPLAMKYPRVIVTRTFSKVHGMAGTSRYAQGDRAAQDRRPQRRQRRGRGGVDSGHSARREAARSDPDDARGDRADVQGGRLPGERFAGQLHPGRREAARERVPRGLRKDGRHDRP